MYVILFSRDKLKCDLFKGNSSNLPIFQNAVSNAVQKDRLALSNDHLNILDIIVLILRYFISET